ncbi:hypothetical protein HHK36_028361 [Tetracentron sinense]|uniref:Uncharacterized protein n=1 Tax=Tetracentron sinense TaxID=13715 RepID=A0A834YB76_TETSI|nr:hypothetical protein HHK36_028361 [Tetracentron sinense]
MGLSECNVEEKEQKGGLDWNFDGEGGFHSKIVGVKGPKCMKEIERLNEWIQFFLNDGGGERTKPFTLVQLLLGKVVFLCEDSGDFEGFEFPPTIEEYLQHDPPTT